MQPTAQRTRPSLCAPAERQVGLGIKFALYECFLVALGGLLTWGGVQQRVWLLLLFGLGFLALAFLQIAIVRKEVRAEAALQRLRKAWLDRAVVRHAAILSRSEEYNPYGETREEAWEHRLTLALEELPGTTVELQVSERVYAQLTKQGSITLYCDPADPLTFLVEGE